MVNTSGEGHRAMVPLEILGWNWGAFTMNWLWGLYNRTYFALLMFVPLVNIPVFVMLGLRGSEWAWRNRRWDSIEHFQRVQRQWAIVGLALMGLTAVAAAAGAIGLLVGTIAGR